MLIKIFNPEKEVKDKEYEKLKTEATPINSRRHSILMVEEKSEEKEKSIFKESPKAQKIVELPKSPKKTQRPLFLLPPLNWKKDDNRREYTLVLDLDETLVHFDHRTRLFQRRPYA